MILFGACSQHSDITTDQESNNFPQSGSSFLALGDSYTIGQNVTADQRWPVLLVKELNKNGKTVTAPDLIATTGWTTGNLLQSLKENPPAKKYDMVSLMIGVNNQYQGLGLEQYRKEFAELLLKSIDYADAETNNVFVLSIPDWSVTPAAKGTDRERTAKEIDSFNAVARLECERQKVLFIDITPISSQALNNPTMMASDGLHFSGKMHQLWVNEVLPLIKNIN